MDYKKGIVKILVSTLTGNKQNKTTTKICKVVILEGNGADSTASTF